ncbi:MULTISPECIES: hypothetical protein [unclassified Streptomyces]|uniref:hypothetical protein n=1 Tax=unclassified Streptomyces TaxID=2593676 RepID=UPI001BE679D4|nr:MULTISPECIES: hypothetical protein [unclassified Streptomyces]MBT2408792.1 hypothetical protein [Streptomyces sp. ISL-21]MBT2612434.1 hypothetical protein [Streptomyces sp. ISL-87]
MPGQLRNIRFVVACAVQGREVDLLISTGANEDPATTFLQVAAWDPTARVFNYSMRTAPSWVWAGNSWSALAPESRGKGMWINASSAPPQQRGPASVPPD